MVVLFSEFLAIAAFVGLKGVAATAAADVEISGRKPDPCAAVAGQRWVAPKDVRACDTSFKVDQAIKTNVCSLHSFIPLTNS